MNHDEGVNALDVQHIIAGWRPIFLPANNGREALFMYTQALVGVLLGVTPMTLRLTAALWGVLTVGLTFGLARRWYGNCIGLVSAGLLAVAFWHVVLSRVGLRAIAAPAFYVGVMWALGAALQRRGTLRFAFAGVLLGLSEYTYISARILPVVLLLICAVILVREGRQRRPMAPLFQQLCVAAAASIVTVLPEAYYFYRHPDMLIGRTDQVLVFSSHPAIIGTPITFQQSIARTFGMFWVAGDTNWLHNIAGLPVLDPVLTILFLVGVGATLWELRRGVPASQPLTMAPTAEMSDGRRRPIPLVPALWLFIWTCTLLAGSSVTQESPNYLRLTALMPAVAIVCSLGVSKVGDFLSRLVLRQRLHAAGRVPALLIVALILGEGVRTASLYFADWARQGGVYTAFDTDIRDAAAASLRQSDVPVRDTFIQLDASAPFLFFRPQTTDARWLREYSSVVALPPAGQPALWIYSHFQATPPLPAYLPQATLVAHGDAYPGHPGYFLYRMAPQALATFRNAFTPPPQPTSFGGSLRLVGTQLQTPTSVDPGGTVTVLLLWQVLQPATVNFGLSVHLNDDHGLTWAQSDRQGMMYNGWQSGDLFVSRHEITVPADTPPIPLHIVASASILDALHQPAAVLQTLGAPAPLTTIQILRGGAGTALPSSGMAAVVPGLSVVAEPLNGGPVRPGDTFTVTLHWLRTASLPSLKVVAALVDAAGEPVATSAGDPGYGALPVNALPTGRVVADPRTFQLPAVLQTGPLRVVVSVTPERTTAGTATISLGMVQAQDRQHTFSVPVSQFPLSATFGSQIALRGYDLPATVVKAGQQLTMTLNWQALKTPGQDYTVFIHLLDAKGQIAAQGDSQPGGGTLPTRGWLPNEVVSDRHVVSLPSLLPAGTYHIELGWYDAASGQRLILAAPPGADHLLLSQDIEVR